MELNINARKLRQRRVLTRANILLSRFYGLTVLFTSAISSLFKFGKKEITPSHKLFRTYVGVVFFVFIIGAVTPSSTFSNVQVNNYYEEGILNEISIGYDTPYVSDYEGFITKINPVTRAGDRTSTNGKLIHIVEAGESLSTIAALYGLKTNTILWENGLTEKSKIKPGDKILVPPVDGVSHVVKKGETIKKIASSYNVSSEAILKQNQLSDGIALKEGQALYIPGAKPLPPPITIVRNTVVRGSRTNVGSSTRVDGSSIGANSDSKPAVGKYLIMPTKAILTQGFHAGHYALDLANPSKPPIWAAADGVVVLASSGTYGGGYGNHVIIDHGNGMRTLYAHMEYLSVGVGDRVNQGQVIGKMGRTGNVRGRTGIHLHFEVMVNGVRKNPYSYM